MPLEEEIEGEYLMHYVGTHALAVAWCRVQGLSTWWLQMDGICKSIVAASVHLRTMAWQQTAL